MKKIVLMALVCCSYGWAACAPASMYLNQIADLALSCEGLNDKAAKNNCEVNIIKDILALKENFNKAKMECALLRDMDF